MVVWWKTARTRSTNVSVKVASNGHKHNIDTSIVTRWRTARTRSTEVAIKIVVSESRHKVIEGVDTTSQDPREVPVEAKTEIEQKDIEDRVHK
jgi:hypothetical protein